mmetsp:Transcript_16712/g.51887  ORF Transcript_16712/g.51887 Transcript_16712/m.51887 type:complete len:264 (+) Transcript_16712:78-869(+)
MTCRHWRRSAIRHPRPWRTRRSSRHATRRCACPWRSRTCWGRSGGTCRWWCGRTAVRWREPCVVRCSTKRGGPRARLAARGHWSLPPASTSTMHRRPHQRRGWSGCSTATVSWRYAMTPRSPLESTSSPSPPSRATRMQLRRLTLRLVCCDCCWRPGTTRSPERLEFPPRPRTLATPRFALLRSPRHADVTIATRCSSATCRMNFRFATLWSPRAIAFSIRTTQCPQTTARRRSPCTKDHRYRRPKDSTTARSASVRSSSHWT